MELKRIPDFDESILEEYAKYYLEALERFEKKLETDKKIRKYKKT